ncbi:hypothetical protein CRUP_004820 [Coryphaenoides rupestris]|nr:hypothetical protein CRUP_004820 [Coryphaenoides rupestris]
MLVLEKQEKYEGHQQFFAVVLLIGTRKQAENFAYRLELNGNRRRLTDCLVFDTSIAHLFADNGNLGINIRSPEVEGRTHIPGIPLCSGKHLPYSSTAASSGHI